MALTTAVPGTIDALVALFAGALDPDAVIDGPGLSDYEPGSYVLVGVDDPDGEALISAADAEQSWAWLGHAARDEKFTIPCAAVCIDGDDDQKAARDGAYAVLATIVDALTTDPSLGGLLLYSAGVIGHQLQQAQVEHGALAIVQFRVECRARLV